MDNLIKGNEMLMEVELQLATMEDGTFLILWNGELFEKYKYEYEAIARMKEIEKIVRWDLGKS